MDMSDLAAFGELLKSYRKRQRLTQQQVARQLALHHNTIGAWERGDYLPATRGMILELARCLHLKEDETQTLLEASLTAVTPRWSVPYQRNPFFTGRHTTLQQIHSLLSAQSGNSSSHRACVLSGLGGIGKTQTALEYAYRHALEYASIFWVSAETNASIVSSFATIARVLKLPIEYIQRQNDVTASVLDWLNTHQDWLLIFDNAHDIALVKHYLPSAQSGSLLFTTRLPTLGTLGISIELQPLSAEESVQLLLRRAGPQAPHQPVLAMGRDDEKAARAIGEAMDGLPLALDQAAAYIEEAHCSLVDFLHLFHHDAAHMLQEYPASTMYHHSVEKTFTLAFDRLQQQDAAAADLLTACCFLAPDEIPEELLIKGKAHLAQELQALLSEPFRLNDAFKHLLAYALLRRNSQSGTLSIHRLIQTVLKERLPEEVQRNWIEMLIRMLDQLLHVEHYRLDAEHWAWNEQMLPHIQRIFQLAEKLHFTSFELGSLLGKTAAYLFQRARYEQAERLYLRALSIQEQTLGENHPDLIPTLAGLARTHLEQEKTQDVEALTRRAIALGEASLGAEDLRLALPLQVLAFLYAYFEENKYQEADALYQRALRIRIKQQGEKHPDVATALNELATLYYYQSYYTQAEPLHMQVLRIREEVLDPHHPEVAEALHDVGALYVRQARYQEAAPLLHRSLSLREQRLGADHPQILIGLNNLADLYDEQANYGLAESLYTRALSICQQVYKSNESFEPLLLNNLAVVYIHQGRYEEAQTYATKSLSLYEKNFPAEHRLLSNPLQSLAQLAYQQGRYAEAEAFCSHALAIREQNLQQYHWALADTLHLHANVYRMQRRYEEAEPLYQRALHIYQRTLGTEHIRIAPLMDDTAMLYQSQSQWEEAEQCYREALRIWECYQELDHPTHADCLDHYAILLDQWQRGQEAAAYRLRAEEMRSRHQTLAHTMLQDLQTPMEEADGQKNFVQRKQHIKKL